MYTIKSLQSLPCGWLENLELRGVPFSESHFYTIVFVILPWQDTLFFARRDTASHPTLSELSSDSGVSDAGHVPRIPKRLGVDFKASWHQH